MPAPWFPRSYREGVRALRSLERGARYIPEQREELESEPGSSAPPETRRQFTEMAVLLLQQHEEIRRLLRDWN